MEFGDIESKVKESLNKLIRDDKFLLNNKIHERSIAFRLGVYLIPFFGAYDIDCEYNGFNYDEEKTKFIDLLKSELIREGIELKDSEKVDENEQVKRKVFPDIIIHKRGKQNNLLAIEIKKYSKNTLSEDQKEARNYDFIKLKKYTDNPHLRYDYGLFVEFITNHSKGYELTWIKRGKEILQNTVSEERISTIQATEVTKQK